MRYKLFGSSGLRVSELCLGTMTFGEEGHLGSNASQSREVFDSFVTAGGNFFDTANIYTNGLSEQLLGQFIKKERERHIVATKYTLSMNEKDPNAFGSHRKNLLQSVHASLRRLDTDYIDLLWVHAWDKETPIQEMMRALDDLISQGKVLYIGASNVPAWVVSSSNTLASFMGWSPFIGLQLEYSLVERTIEREYFGLANMLNLMICSWSPIAGGVLTGKYSNQIPSDARYFESSIWSNRYVTESNLLIAKEVMAIAEELGRDPAQVALNWIRQKNNHIIPIIGSKTVTQLESNLGCLDFSLSEAQLARLDQVSAISLGFPYEFLDYEGMDPYLCRTGPVIQLVRKS